MSAIFLMSQYSTPFSSNRLACSSVSAPAKTRTTRPSGAACCNRKSCARIDRKRPPSSCGQRFAFKPSFAPATLGTQISYDIYPAIVAFDGLLFPNIPCVRVLTEAPCELALKLESPHLRNGTLWIDHHQLTNSRALKKQDFRWVAPFGCCNVLTAWPVRSSSSQGSPFLSRLMRRIAARSRCSSKTSPKLAQKVSEGGDRSPSTHSQPSCRAGRGRAFLFRRILSGEQTSGTSPTEDFKGWSGVKSTVGKVGNTTQT